MAQELLLQIVKMMSNAEKYFFNDFTTDNYRRLLGLIKNNFVVSKFTDYDLSEKFAILRHDVDFSVQRALKIARIEAELGIKATYFILLHSEFYNLLEKENFQQIKTIIDLDHTIGLHFDTSFFNIVEEDVLVKKLELEKKFLENLFEKEINSFSFHITSPYTATCTKDHYAGMLNVYSTTIQKNIEYCSDSNGYWRFKRLEDVIQDKKTRNLQILTHPELWQDSVMSPKERVYRCADGRAAKSKAWYDAILKNNGRENIDW